MSERVRTFAPGEEVAIAPGFEYEGDREIESVEAVFVREGSGEEIVLLGEARKEASGDRTARYAARLAARIVPGTASGEYRCARLSARDRLDDDWYFTDSAKLDLIICVKRTLRRLEVTACEFL